MCICCFFFLFSGWSAFDAFFLVRFGVIWHNVVLLFFLFSRLALRAVMFLYIEWLREGGILMQVTVLLHIVAYTLEVAWVQ